MQVAATHAALLLAQGTGRLIRTTTDRGVVAVLDPRLVTARYGVLPAGQPAADVGHDRPGGGPQGAGPAVRLALTVLRPTRRADRDGEVDDDQGDRHHGPAGHHVEHPVVAGADDDDAR